MNNVNNSCNNEEEETKLLISSLLAAMILEVLLMRQQRRLKLTRERVRRCRKGKRQVNTNEYMHRVREQKQKNRQARR